MLHGLGSTGASFYELATSLGASYNVLALDLPGHGSSTPLPDTKLYTAQALAEWVLAVLSQLNIKDFHIVGHSIGGNIGLAIAKTNCAKSVILLDGGYLRSSSIPGSSLEEEVKMEEQNCVSYAFSSWQHYVNALKEEGLSDPLIEMVKTRMADDGKQIKMILQSDVAGMYMKQHYDEPTAETLTGIKIPVLLLRSTRPEEFNAHREVEVDRLRQQLNVTVENVEDASHDIYWEQPATVCASIKQWISTSG